MFIRWKKRQLKVKDRDNVIEERPGRDKEFLAYLNKEAPPGSGYWRGYTIQKYGWKDGPGHSLGAYVVESYRDDDGKPRQRNVAYLGSVRFGEDRYGKEREPFPNFVWKKFYNLVDDGTIPTSQADKLTTALADKIGLMTAEEIAAWQEEAKKLRREFRRAFGGRS